MTITDGVSFHHAHEMVYMKPAISDSSIIVFSVMLFMAGCGDNNKSAGISAMTSLSPAPQITATAPLSSSPSWITKAHKDLDANCYLDVVNGTNLKPGGVSVSIEKGVPLVMAGWAIDKKRRCAQSDAAFEPATSDRKQVYLFVGKRSQRLDVSSNEKFRDLALEMAGLSVVADTREMAAGVYEVSVIMRRGDEEGIACAIGKAWKVEL
jgi:hypothetical protein